MFKRDMQMRYDKEAFAREKIINDYYDKQKLLTSANKLADRYENDLSILNDRKNTLMDELDVAFDAKRKLSDDYKKTNDEIENSRQNLFRIRHIIEENGETAELKNKLDNAMDRLDDAVAAFEGPRVHSFRRTGDNIVSKAARNLELVEVKVANAIKLSRMANLDLIKTNDDFNKARNLYDNS